MNLFLSDLYSKMRFNRFLIVEAPLGATVNFNFNFNLIIQCSPFFPLLIGYKDSIPIA